MTETTHGAHQLWLEVGRTLDVWQRVEQQLCEIFVTILQPSVGDAARAAFYKVTSVRTKRSMISASLSMRIEDEGLLDQWKRLSKRIDEESKHRNMLAHGTMWVFNEQFVVGPHFNDVALRDRYMDAGSESLMDAPKIHALQKSYWELAHDLTAFARDLGLHTMSFGKPINLPRGRV